MHDESKRLFVEALALAPGDREDFLLATCGDDSSLRQEVESLLQHHESLALEAEPGENVRGGLRTTLRGVVRGWVQERPRTAGSPGPPAPGSDAPSDRAALD